VSVGLVEQGQSRADRQAAYSRDVTYCSNKEIVFDYLRDRLALDSRSTRARFQIQRALDATQPSGLLLRGLHFAIIDEADSILIDEARTPLILSGVEDSRKSDAEQYEIALSFAERLRQDDHFQLLSQGRVVRLTKAGELELAGMAKGMQGVWRIRQAREELVRQALVALRVFRRDVQYIVKDGKVHIIDEFTGRLMPDRSWERGLHQLIEVKEQCELTTQRYTLARITYQRFFRRYVHLCGMTGTATEAAGELRSVYGLSVVRIPTNRPLQRRNLGQRTCLTAETKWNAVVESARAAAACDRAVLIGTRSVDASEQLTARLRRAGLDPLILNARQDQQEAEIIGAAGQPRRITVATNMAGRGTDIKLHPLVRDAGGLHVILTEFHESVRIDRQLFGRTGRQGDPGTFESIVSLDDELFQRFCPKLWLKAACRSGNRRGLVQGALAGLLRRLSQRSAERTNARARLATLLDDQSLGKLLGFTGAE
jgi:preprotein translocase subunit SecA